MAILLLVGHIIKTAVWGAVILWLWYHGYPNAAFVTLTVLSLIHGLILDLHASAKRRESNSVDSVVRRVMGRRR